MPCFHGFSSLLLIGMMAVTMKRRPKSMYGEYSTLSAGSKPSGPFRAAQSENSDASKLQVTRPQLCGLREARWACKLFPAFWNVSHFQSKRELLLKKKKKKRARKEEPSLLYKTSFSFWVFYTLNSFEGVTAFSVLEVRQRLSRWFHHF